LYADLGDFNGQTNAHMGLAEAAPPGVAECEAVQGVGLPGELAQLAGPAGEQRRRRRQLAGHRRPCRARPGRGRGGAGQRRIAGQDLLVQPLQFRAWVDAEFLGQLAPAGLIVRQRVAGAAAPVQGEHQLTGHALAQRVRAGPGG
jgi:hypothetical protein